MENLTNEELMTTVAEGKLNNMRYLFERHHKHIFNFLLKMSRDRIISQDLTQEVFYNMIKYRKSYNSGKFTSWMFTIARNSLSNHFKNKKESHSALETLTTLPDEGDNGEEYMHLYRAIEKLPVSDQELIVLNRFQGIKYDELAEIVQSTPGAVKVKVSRALKKLKNLYFQVI